MAGGEIDQKLAQAQLAVFDSLGSGAVGMRAANTRLAEEEQALLPELKNEYQLAQFFREADTNSDGVISGMELQVALEKVNNRNGKNVSTLGVRRLIAAGDGDGDGHLDYAELCKLFSLLGNPQRPADLAAKNPQQQSMDVSLAHRAHVALKPLYDQQQVFLKLVERHQNVPTDGDYPPELRELLKKILAFTQTLHVKVSQAGNDRAGIETRMFVCAELKDAKQALAAALHHLGTLISRVLKLTALRCTTAVVEELCTSTMNFTTVLRTASSRDFALLLGTAAPSQGAGPDPFADAFGSPEQSTEVPAPADTTVAAAATEVIPAAAEAPVAAVVAATEVSLLGNNTPSATEASATPAAGIEAATMPVAGAVPAEAVAMKTTAALAAVAPAETPSAEFDPLSG